MSGLPQGNVPIEPYLAFPIDRAEARHLLRALTRASAYAVRAAVPDERPRARADATAYDGLRARLLDDVARRDIELDLDDGDVDD
jgi:hypothetical protein